MNPVKPDSLFAPTLPGADAAIQPAAALAEGGDDAAYRVKVAMAAEKFESFFISQMLRQMRSATREMAGEDSLFRNRVNDDMLDLADTALAETLAGQRAFGIADAVVRQMLPPAPPSQPADTLSMAGIPRAGRNGFNSGGE